MDSLLVTGGAGFIGGNFVRDTLAESSFSIINLDRLTYAGNLDSLASVWEDPRHIFVQGDICDRELIKRLLNQHQPRGIIHFAAESHVDRSIDSPLDFLQTNVVGTATLLEASLAYWDGLAPERRDSFRFLHVSTDEVYGSLGPTGKFVETTPYAPNSPYAASKAASDHFVRAYHHTYGFQVLTTNCSNNYGPFQFPEKLIPLMILNALEGKELPLYGDGSNVRDWLHVRDHCRAIRLVLKHGRVGEVYNIGGDAERTNREVVETICQVVDKLRPDLPHAPCTSLIRLVTDRPGHDRRYAIDFGKLSRELKWQPEIPFERGIEETVGWYLENQEWVEGITSGKYQRQRLGLDHGHRQRSPAKSQSSESAKPMEYREGPIDGVICKPLQAHHDPRGWLVELFREDELPAENRPAMAYVSETLPGVVRGPHDHVDQADFFAFLGPGDFELHLWDARPGSGTRGNRAVHTVGASNPQAVIIPPGVVHAYRNISEASGWVFNAPNRLYAGWGKQSPVDEIRYEEVPGSPFCLP